VGRSSLKACSKSYGAHGVSGARTAASTSSTARWTRLADAATQARTFPTHPKVLGTEVRLRQRVAAACNSRAGRRAERPVTSVKESADGDARCYFGGGVRGVGGTPQPRRRPSSLGASHRLRSMSGSRLGRPPSRVTKRWAASRTPETLPPADLMVKKDGSDGPWTAER
jgi:hypothetical protein